MTPPNAPSQPPAAGPEAGPGSWGIFRRRCWRGFRISVRLGYAAVALVAYALFHLYYIGLPGFLKDPLLAMAQAQGLELDYSRIRFLPVRGLVTDSVNLHLRGHPASKFIYVQQLWLRMDWTPLLELQAPRLAAIEFIGGQAAHAIEGAPGEPVALVRLEQLAGELQFPSNDEWHLTWLKANVHGATLEAMGSFSDVQLYLGRPQPPTKLGFRNPLLARVLLGLDEIQYREPPRVELHFAINGAQLERSVVQARLVSVGATGPHGEFDDVGLSVDVQPARSSPGLAHGVVRSRSAAARTEWGAFESLRFRADILFVPTNALPRFTEWTLAANSLAHTDGQLKALKLHGVTVATNRMDGEENWDGLAAPRVVARREAPAGLGFLTDLDLTATDLRSRWITLSNLTAAAQLWNATNQWLPRAMDWVLHADEAVTRQARARELDLVGSVLPVAPDRRPDLPGFWTNATPWRLQASLHATNLFVSPRHEADHLNLLLDWQGDTLVMTNFNVRLPAGRMAGDATLAVGSRRLTLDLLGDLEPLRLEPLLPAPTWQQVTNSGVRPGSPVHFDLQALGQMPTWETPVTNWFHELIPAMTVQGTFAVTNLGLHEVVLREARVPFELSSESLRIAGLHLAMDPGELTGDGEAEFTSGRWHARATSSLNPLDFRSLVNSPVIRTQFELLGLSQPPALQGEVWGDWHDGAHLGAMVRLALTNATYRNEPITELRTSLTYTNQQLVFLGTELLQGTNQGRAPGMLYDIPTQLLHLTNAFSTLDVVSLLRAIGPKTAQILDPYHFLEAPTVRANGTIPMTDDVTGSVVFQASVPRFQWWYFEFDHLLATVGWTGNQISITNVAGGFYGGLVVSDVQVNVSDRNDAVFGFNATFNDVQLPLLLKDLTTGTNRLEGEMSGQVIVREGHARPEPPWSGHGNAQLRNGYLWDLPLFGLLSPVFNTISPGLGAAKFRAGNATFTITNHEVNFSQIELLSPAMRLQLHGPVDFDSRLKLVLEAEPLRDVPLVGPLVNLVLTPFTKLLEYDIRGTLEKPEAELRHVPSFLLIPLQPFTTLKNIFGGTPSAPKDAPLIPPARIAPVP